MCIVTGSVTSVPSFGPERPSEVSKVRGSGGIWQRPNPELNYLTLDLTLTLTIFEYVAQQRVLCMDSLVLLQYDHRRAT